MSTTSKRYIDAGLHLLDRQVLDVNGEPVTVVDDIEISGLEPNTPIDPDHEPPTMTALLAGAVVLNRLFGGRPPLSRLYRIDWTSVSRIGTSLELGVRGESLDISWPERWVRDHIIARIPGSNHDPE